MLDIIIRNGSLIDGTGSPARMADVGIKDGRIVAIGEITDHASEEIDASGMAVTPGFIDVHTHLDAQVYWDPAMSPLPEHGVTTIVGGNCGLSLAPAPEDADEREWLLGLFGSVEAIPMSALREGLDVTWRTYGEYLEAIDKPLGANAAFFVGHGGLRRAVMGPDASATEATPEQIEAMKKLLGESLAAGGLGFSTATQPSHLDGQGKRTPAQFAAREEFIELSSVLADFDGTALQITPGSAAIGFSDEDKALIADMAIAAGRPLFWLAPVINKSDPTCHKRMLDTCNEAAERGGELYGLSLPTVGPLRQSFDNPFFMRIWAGTWGEVMTMPLEARIEALKDQAVRDELAKSLADADGHFSKQWKDKWGRMEIVDTQNSELQQYVGRSVEDISSERDTDDFNTLLDIACADNLETGFATYEATGSDDDPWVIEAKRFVHTDSRVVWGGSDAGAHVDALVGGDFPARVFSDYVRKYGAFTNEEAVHYMAAEPARIWGLTDRGTIQEGNFADVLIFDIDNIEPSRMKRITDWPGGAWRLTTSSIGMDTVIVNGKKVLSGGEYTGDLGGKVLRSGIDTTSAGRS